MENSNYLNEADLFCIEQLISLRNRCVLCTKPLYNDPQVRRIWLDLHPEDCRHNPGLVNTKIRLVVCNACGIRYHKSHLPKKKQVLSKNRATKQKCLKFCANA